MMRKAGNIILQSGVKSHYYPWRPWFRSVSTPVRRIFLRGAPRKDAAGAGDAFIGALAAIAGARQADMVAAIQYASAFALAVE